MLFPDIDIDSRRRRPSPEPLHPAEFGAGCLLYSHPLDHPTKKIRDQFINAAKTALTGTKIGHGIEPQIADGTGDQREAAQPGGRPIWNGASARGAEWVLLRGGATDLPGCEQGYYVKLLALLGGNP